MENLIHELVSHNLLNRHIAILENGSWAASSGKLMREALSALKGTEFIGENLSIKSALKEGQLAQLEALAEAIAAEING